MLNEANITKLEFLVLTFLIDVLEFDQLQLFFSFKITIQNSELTRMQKCILLNVAGEKTCFLPVCHRVDKISRFTICSMFQSISRRQQDSLAEANQVATETFSHIKTVKSFANEDGQTEKYRERLDNTFRINKMESVAYAVNMWSSTVSVQRFLYS